MVENTQTQDDHGALTRADLCHAVHREIGLPKAECAKLVDTVLGEICGALGHGEIVKLTGFGTFLIREKAERTGRNPKTGVVVPITGRRVLSFRACEKMRARVAQGVDAG